MFMLSLQTVKKIFFLILTLDNSKIKEYNFSILFEKKYNIYKHLYLYTESYSVYRKSTIMVTHQKEKKCPICGEMHPAGSNFCPKKGVEIKQSTIKKQLTICFLVIVCIAITAIFVLVQNQENEIVGESRTPTRTDPTIPRIYTIPETTPNPTTKTTEITVNIVPEINEAKWKINNSPWKKSGDTYDGKTGREYNIVFKNVQGWITPKNKIITPQSYNPINITGKYRRKTINIYVRLEPNEVAHKAKWKIHNASNWKRSGESVRVETEKKYEIIYNRIDGWVSPENKLVNCQTNIDLSFYARYKRMNVSTSITVTIEPFDARNAGAKWKIDPWDWQDSGDTLDLMIPATYKVQCKNVPGWQKPSRIDVSVNKGQNKQIIRTYLKQ